MQDRITGGNQARRLGQGTRFGDGRDPDVGAGTRFKKGQSGNPAGKPKGRHLSTVIREMLDDEGFIERIAAQLPEGAIGPDAEYQGTPMRAIITAAMVEAMNPESKPQSRQAARDWLAKYGFGTKVDVTVDGPSLTNPYAELTTEELRKLAELG